MRRRRQGAPSSAPPTPSTSSVRTVPGQRPAASKLRPRGEVSPALPQNPLLSSRARTTRSSPPAPPLASPAWLKETRPRTSPGCSMPSPSRRRHAAFRSRRPRLSSPTWLQGMRACFSACWTTGLARQPPMGCSQYSQVCRNPPEVIYASHDDVQDSGLLFLTFPNL